MGALLDWDRLAPHRAFHTWLVDRFPELSALEQEQVIHRLTWDLDWARLVLATRERKSLKTEA